MSPSGRLESKRRFERKGRRAEWMAALALMLKRYRIVALRYKTPVGEIDIVARKGDLIALVEVKARRDLISGVDAVSYPAQRRIAAAGALYISRQPDSARLSWRCDIVVVSPWRWPQHLEDAF
ncbi:MAG: YraN family protein [Hoeflea sp.]|uniref:YraN family protein n=1 Tax=Hoeflea sp. TaxID=1940281 RepID=UPI001D321F65|nr:YraN family protein [Hoeflea sp.]MBU4531449.1 YraN family protein [Alphaproteobacteria bacterium]MBU4544306.1 YraN family protein [Alphaproteobacteria bacterium]MBU4550457.1 YraN family protein [Alphaproteobacteria bacterium]MBV1724725.1 YraN family protein [Hoeflea sp.]MBV1760745.1 YraN family protein [Hoeflea sp.]